MRDMFWLREGVLAGSAGPNRSIWNLKELNSQNIVGVLSLNDGAMVRESDLSSLGIAYKRVSLPDSAPPEPGSVEICNEALPKALDFVEENTKRGGATLVHCSSGKDRTGIFLSYYLCNVESYSPADAVDAIRKVRPVALTAPGWEELVYEVLRSDTR